MAKHLTYDETVRRFEDTILPSVVKQYGADDVCAIDEAWNDFTDALRTEDSISFDAYDNWIYTPTSEKENP
jgi:hypothetical protein